MGADIRRTYASDPESRLRQRIRRALADPVKPEDVKGRLRPSPVLLVFGAAIAITVGTFFYFFFCMP
jgi:hypothetical protein